MCLKKDYEYMSIWCPIDECTEFNGTLKVCAKSNGIDKLNETLLNGMCKFLLFSILEI